MSSVSSCWVHSHTRILHIPSVQQQQDQGEKSLRHEQIVVNCQVHYMILDKSAVIGADLSPSDIVEMYLKLIIISSISGSGLFKLTKCMWNIYIFLKTKPVSTLSVCCLLSSMTVLPLVRLAQGRTQGKSTTRTRHWVAGNLIALCCTDCKWKEKIQRLDFTEFTQGHH